MPFFFFFSFSFSHRFAPPGLYTGVEQVNQEQGEARRCAVGGAREDFFPFFSFSSWVPPYLGLSLLLGQRRPNAGDALANCRVEKAMCGPISHFSFPLPPPLFFVVRLLSVLSLSFFPSFFFFFSFSPSSAPFPPCLANSRGGGVSSPGDLPKSRDNKSYYAGALQIDIVDLPFFSSPSSFFSFLPFFSPPPGSRWRATRFIRRGPSRRAYSSF